MNGDRNDGMISLVNEVTGLIVDKVTETSDDFIFTTAAGWLGKHPEMSQLVLSKEILVRALKCYVEEHNDEYNKLLGACKERIEGDVENEDNKC